MWFPWLSTQRCQDMIWEKMNSIFMWATPSSEDYFKSGQPTLLFKLPWPKCRACSLSLPTVPLHGYAGSLNEHELNQVTWTSAQEASLWISIPSLFSPLACVCPPVCDWHGFILLPRTALAPQFTSDACLPACQKGWASFPKSDSCWPFRRHIPTITSENTDHPQLWGWWAGYGRLTEVPQYTTPLPRPWSPKWKEHTAEQHMALSYQFDLATVLPLRQLGSQLVAPSHQH